jgi:hypothetical protein
MAKKSTLLKKPAKKAKPKVSQKAGVSKNKFLTGDQLQKMIFESLIPYDKLDVLDRYAVFMGKSQIVELALKRLLVDKFNYNEEDLERTTLGATVNLLEKEKLRGDFIHILRELNKHRNHMAHSFLAIHLIGQHSIGSRMDRLSQKDLNYALYSVQQVIHVYDFLTENKMF